MNAIKTLPSTGLPSFGGSRLTVSLWPPHSSKSKSKFQKKVCQRTGSAVVNILIKAFYLIDQLVGKRRAPTQAMVA